MRFSLSFSLSLSAFFLISALLSDDDERGRIIARDDSRVLLLLLLRVFFFSSFTSTLGKFYSRRHHGGVCVGCVLLSSSRIFFLLFLSSSFRAELCALFCMHVLFLSRISSFPLYLSNSDYLDNSAHHIFCNLKADPRHYHNLPQIQLFRTTIVTVCQDLYFFRSIETCQDFVA